MPGMGVMGPVRMRGASGSIIDAESADRYQENISGLRQAAWVEVGSKDFLK